MAYISAMGVRWPSAEQVAVFAKVLGCTTNEIILGTGLALELKQEREFFEQYRAATPEKREAARASLGEKGVWSFHHRRGSFCGSTGATLEGKRRVQRFLNRDHAAEPGQINASHHGDSLNSN